MNRRERIITALNHTEPDRIPVDLDGSAVTSILGLAYARLREYLGLEKRKIRIHYSIYQLAEVDEDVLRLCNVDVLNIDRTLSPAMGRQVTTVDFPLFESARNGIQEYPCEMVLSGEVLRRISDGWGLFDREDRQIYMKPDSSLYFDQVFFPLESATTISDIRPFRWMNPQKEYYAELRKRARYLRQNTDYALMGSFAGNILELGQALRGWDRFMMDLAENNSFTQYLLDLMADNWLEHLERYLQSVGDTIDIILFSDDLGMQQAPLLSPHLYRKTIHPRHKRLYTYVREHYPGVFVFLHCCGAIYPLIHYLIDEGVQILNPVQTTAAGMNPEKLKKEFGRDLVFWGGGIDTQHILPRGTPGQIQDTVHRMMQIFGEGGGYVFCQVHNIQAGIGPENIWAMYKAVSEFNYKNVR